MTRRQTADSLRQWKVAANTLNICSCGKPTMGNTPAWWLAKGPTIPQCERTGMLRKKDFVLVGYETMAMGDQMPKL